uniref:Cytochrome P450 n=1 Tax=Tetranychus urticae TaxID=32264 RepID=T1JQT9_TETUR
MLIALKKLPQKPGNWLMGHLGDLLPPPFISNNQFGQGLKNCVDKMEKFLHENGLMVFWVSWYPIVVITSPSILFQLTPATIEKGPGPDVARSFFGDGLVTQNSTKWKGRRKLLAPGYQQAALANYLPIVSEIARNRVNTLGNTHIIDEPVDTRKFTQETGMDMTCEIALGVKGGKEGSPGWQYRKAIDVALEMLLIKSINPFYWFDFIFRFTIDGRRSKQAAEYIRSFPTSLINVKKTTHVPGSINPKAYNPAVRFSLLDCLIDLHLQSQCDNKKFGFTTLDVLEEVNNALFAGNETTGGTMAWTMFHLAANPDIQDKVYQELVENRFTAKEFIDYNEENLKSLKYLDCCVKESLRLCPPIHTITRRLDQDLITDDGQVIPKGSVLALCIYYIHRDPKYWPEPTKYNPERFLTENSFDRPSLAYIPFGFGQRQCLGQKLAMREIKVVIAEVIRRFRLENCQSFDEIETAFLGTYRSIESLKIKFFPRNRSFSYLSTLRKNRVLITVLSVIYSILKSRFHRNAKN